MLVPSRNVIPSWTPRVWARSSRRSQTPRRAQRRKVWAARDHGPRSAGMARHLAPFWCRQTIADSVRRRSFGCVLPLGRHASISGSKLIQCASDSIALSSFQEGQNARHHNRFKREQALILKQIDPSTGKPYHPAFVWTFVAERTYVNRKAHGGFYEEGKRYPITYNGLGTFWRRWKSEH